MLKIKNHINHILDKAFSDNALYYVFLTPIMFCCWLLSILLLEIFCSIARIFRDVSSIYVFPSILYYSSAFLIALIVVLVGLAFIPAGRRRFCCPDGVLNGKILSLNVMKTTGAVIVWAITGVSALPIVFNLATGYRSFAIDWLGITALGWLIYGLMWLSQRILQLLLP
ncbi:MAG: hypothetical protein ACPLTR_08470 [Thermacetogeniaceae bacterium]